MRLSHPEYEPLDVWIDAQGRVRQQTLAFSYEVQGRRMKMTQTAKCFDFGKPVSITLPRPDEVVDMTALMGLGG
jgi:hypothetical protein